MNVVGNIIMRSRQSLVLVFVLVQTVPLHSAVMLRVWYYFWPEVVVPKLSFTSTDAGNCRAKNDVRHGCISPGRLVA